MSVAKLIAFHKPYGVLSQFRDPQRPVLGDYIDVPDVYPAGRLDMDSEGLLLLTDDGALQARISHPRFRLPKAYWVQIEAQPDAQTIARTERQLIGGVALRDGPAHAVSLRPLSAPALAPRRPEVTPHRAARSSWVEVLLTEGRNRQVRRMLAAVGWPVLRLFRARIGPIDLRGLAPGAWAERPVPGDWADAVRRPPRGRPGARR